MTNVTCNSSCSEYEIIGCGGNLTKAGNYVVTTNISITTQDCINVTANDVVLDCDHKILTGSGAGSGVWIMASNVTVKNCNITSFWNGLRINGGANNKLYDNTVTNSTNKGIAITSTTNGELIGNNASNQEQGAEITDSSLNTTNNVFCGNWPRDISCSTSTFTGSGNRARRISGDCIATGFPYSGC